MVKLAELICAKCGHRWRPRIERVKQCPRCKSYHWKEKRLAKA